MNLNLVRSYIKEYINNFERINRQEIYKWRAVKCFQDNWNIKTKNFANMIEKSLSQSMNLLQSGRYFARDKLLLNTGKSTEKIRELFVNLYNEE